MEKINFFSRKSLFLIVIGIILAGNLSLFAAAPALVSSSPANGATGVAVDSTVTFTFDTPMYPNTVLGSIPPYLTGAIVWSANVNALFVSYTWSADNLTLTCTYRTSLPADAQITWVLQPADATIPLMSMDQESLPSGVYSGSFTTAGSGSGTNALGVISLTKTLGYQQTNPTNVVLFPDAAAFYNSAVQSPPTNVVTNAWLVFPNNSTNVLQPNILDNTSFMDYLLFASQGELEASVPPGTYTFHAQRQNSTMADASMTVPDASAFPPVPKISNFDAAQSINPTNTFTFQWGAFTGAGPDDAIHFYIDDENSKNIFDAPTEAHPLTSTATSITIPANLLTLGKTNQGVLCFSHIFFHATNSPVGFMTVGSLTRTTYFPIGTSTGTLPSKPSFSAYGRTIEGNIRLTITAQPGSGLTVEACPLSDFSSLTQVLTTNTPSSGTVVFEEKIGGQKRFYRAKAN